MRYIHNALQFNSQAMELVTAVVKELSIAVVLGFAEQSPSHSIYISQAIISPRGEVLVHRRNIKSTYMESTLFGGGSGPDLNNVAKVNFGPQYGKMLYHLLS
jgi:nitrilase